MTDNASPKERRFLLCTGERVLYKNLYRYPTSHIVGEFKYRQVMDLQVTVLERWWISAKADTVPPIGPRLDCVCYGNVDRIVCRAAGECPNETYWDISENALIAMVKAMIRR
jgi:hypothetical protein